MRARLHVCKVIRGNIVIIIAVILTVRKPELPSNTPCIHHSRCSPLSTGWNTVAFVSCYSLTSSAHEHLGQCSANSETQSNS